MRDDTAPPPRREAEDNDVSARRFAFVLREVLRSGPTLAVAYALVTAAQSVLAAARRAPPWHLDVSLASLLGGVASALGWGAFSAMLLGFVYLGRDFEDRDPARPYRDA